MAIKKKKVIDKGLTRKQAMDKFPYKRGMGDCRAFNYNKKTGEAVWS